MSHTPDPGGHLRAAGSAWARAALDEIEVAGVRALAVDAVARRVGAERSTFFHHFADRRALLRAALGLWESTSVVALNATFRSTSDPRARLRQVMEVAMVDIRPSVVVQLMTAADDPDVAAVLARAADARLALLAAALMETGQSPETARRRALVLYSAYLGSAQLRRHVPDQLEDADRRRALADELVDLVLDDPHPGRGRQGGAPDDSEAVDAAEPVPEQPRGPVGGG